MDILVQFEQFELKNKKSANTVESYKRDLDQFLNYIDKNASEINQEDIDQYAEYLHEQKNKNGEDLSVKTINRKLVSINRFIAFLNKFCDLKITAKADQLKVQKQTYLDEVLSKAEFDRIVKAAEKKNDYRAQAIFYTLYFTGMRVSEMLQLDLDDVKEESISIKGKGSKYRDVFISDKLKAILKEYLKYRMDKGDKLFTGERGPITRKTVDKIIKYYAGQAKVKLAKAHAHNFRHLYCLTLIEKGVPIDTVADLAGHSDINTTRIYTRKTKKQLLKTINQL